LVPAAYTLFIVPALAAAILARFNYLSIAVLAGIGIGMLQSEVGFLKSQHSFLPSSGLPELVPLVLILLVLVVRARPLPTRGALIQQHLGRAPRPRRLGPSALVGMAVGVVALVALHGSWRAAAVTSLVYGIIALSLVVVTGYAGQVSLAQLTLAGVGAFLLAPLTASWGVPFPFAPLLAALGATIIGVIVGLPAVRIRGLPLAVVTLALAVAVQALWFQNTDIVTSGGKNVSGPSFLGVDLRAHIGAAYPRLGFSIMVLIVVAMVAVGVAKLRTSRLGSAMLAVRANERSAAAAGVNVMWTKLVAFALAAFIAGIGGSMLAYLQGNVTFDPFDVILGLGLFATAYLAGITSVSGGVLAGVLAVGGLVFYASDQWLSLGGDWYQVLTGLGLILTVVLNPEGLVGPIHDGLDRRRWRRAQAEPPREAVPVAPVRPSLAALETAPSTPVLSLCDITVHYGGVTAVSGVSLEINEGDIAGLIGPNGAGKTTLVDAISGFAEASGTVTLDGRRLDHLKPHRRVRAGLGRTFQGIEIWGDLSVGENVMVGVAGAARRDGEAGDGDHQQILDRLHLSEVGDRPAGELSQGQRRLVSIARALVARPRVLILDEPAAGLDSTESQWLGERLRDIRALGTTILVIDHDMSLVLNLCDPIHVLNFGALIASGSPTAIRSDRAVAEAYLGTTGADRSTVTA
jgi:ABC-type branched-subunit amino acid transport system ATPase component/ABC-type branched-subunit amino acid transport system permease subunit